MAAGVYPKALDQADSLLVETAGRPGAVGRRMTLSILSAATNISPSAYLTACKRAVDTGDGQRVQSLIEQAESCLSEPLPALPGVAILHAYTNGHRNMAKDLIAQCTSKQIAAAPPNLLRLVAERLDFQTAMELVDKGVQPGDYAADVLHTLTGQHQEWMAEKLLEHGMPVEPDNYAALYTNGCISEYVACHIFEMLGFRVQDTLLGNYTDSRGKSKLVVACRDFTEGGKRLIEFAQLKNTCIDSEQNGYGKELDSILEAVNEQTLYPADELRAFFWDMFIADAFLGNFDRHNGNWGLLVNEEEQSVEIAPIYDCGSCLYPQLDLPHMAEVLNSQEEIDRRIYVFPASAVEEHGVKIPYFDFISSLRCPECNDALRRVTARIDLDRIQKFLDGVPELQPIQREFYLTMLTERKEKILDYSLDLLLREEQQPGAPELTM